MHRGRALPATALQARRHAVAEGFAQCAAKRARCARGDREMRQIGHAQPELDGGRGRAVVLADERADALAGRPKLLPVQRLVRQPGFDLRRAGQRGQCAGGAARGFVQADDPLAWPANTESETACPDSLVPAARKATEGLCVTLAVGSRRTLPSLSTTATIRGTNR